ncbi:MAG: hypothetical protein GY856_36450 [bacterium]|nr:hypothetical protein [bacterium]
MDTKPKVIETPCEDSAVPSEGDKWGDAPERPRYRKPQLKPYGQLRPNLQLGTPPPPP